MTDIKLFISRSVEFEIKIHFLCLKLDSIINNKKRKRKTMAWIIHNLPAKRPSIVRTNISKRPQKGKKKNLKSTQKNVIIKVVIVKIMTIINIITSNNFSNGFSPLSLSSSWPLRRPLYRWNTLPTHTASS